ncbi:Fatty acyl-CoA reductase 8 [Bienertia sinuspersici]
MDSSLSEEEKRLESSLNQVNEMMLHCGEGLQHLHWNSIFEMQHMGMVDNNLRSKMNDPEKDLSVRAAAASIYSTCNYISSQENVSCC